MNSIGNDYNNNNHKLILTARQAKALDDYTIANGTSSETLIKRAAKAMAECVDEFFIKKGRVLCFVGPGNNGADAYEFGKILESMGSRVRYCKVSKEGLDYSGDAEISIKNAELTVDGIFGIGLNRAPEGFFRKAIEQVNEAYAYGSKVLAVDVPSGVNSTSGGTYENVVHADLTVTFGFMKYAHVLYPAKKFCGKVEVKDIGFDLSFFKTDGKTTIKSPYGIIGESYDLDLALSHLPERFPESNKGSYCNAMLVCGSEKIPGAAVLAGNAAYRLGAGYVTLCSDENVRNIAVGIVPELLLCPKEELKDRFEKNKYDTILFGPGVGKSEESRAELELMLANKPVKIIDADGINMLAEMLDEHFTEVQTDKDTSEYGEDGKINDRIKKRMEFLNGILPENTVLTPHRKELSRLLDIPMTRLSGGNKWVADIICETGKAIFVLKEASTIVCTKDRLFVNTTGNNGLSKAGCGDVLAGMLAALCGKSGDKDELFERCCLAVWLHGAAGDRLKDLYSEYGVLPSEIAKTAAEIIAGGHNSDTK